MTEPNERITALETNMAAVLANMSKRETFQDTALVKLTTIELKQDQSLNYQKTCDAERTAHATRLGVVENTVAAMARTMEMLEGISIRLAAVERHIAKGTTVWWVMLKIAGALGGILTVCAAAIEIWHR